MLFSTNYPSYQDPIGEAHENNPHPLQHGMRKISDYVGDFFAALFVMAFTGLELVFLAALAVLVLKGLATWNVMPDVWEGATQHLQSMAE